MNETALSTISVLPSSRDEVARFARQLKNEILANDRDPLKVLVQLKWIEKVIADVLKDEEIDLCFLKELLKYSSKEQVVIAGAKLSEQETGVKYDYNSSGDPVWLDLEKEIQALTEKRKARETFLKALPREGTVDPDTGVYITQPPKSSKTKVVVRLS